VITTAAQPTIRHPVVRVRPAPAIDPPFDDERTDDDIWPVWAAQLEIRPTEPWAAPPVPPPSAPPVAPSPPAPPSPESRIAAQRFVSACVEALNGFRPVAHLRPLVAPLDFGKVCDQLTRRAVRVRMAPPRGSRRQRPSQVALRRMRVCEPCSGVAEAAAVISHGDGAWAMAVRLERRRGHWLCTLLQVL
jgi:Family of unknown function (DUF6459)